MDKGGLEAPLPNYYLTIKEEIMTDIQFSECLICGWTFIDNVGPKSCIMCGATKDEEYIDYDKIAKDNKSDVDYENGQRDY